MAEQLIKICSKCKEAKEISAFSKDAQKIDGLNSQCSVCKSVLNKSWYARNSERHNEKQQIYKKNNALRILQQAKEYRVKNKKEVNARVAQWQKENLDKCAFYTSKRRAAQAAATPAWLSEEQLTLIQEFYSMAKELETVFPWKQHVDHITPINGKNVCGLNVPWNLQILSKQANLQKGNKHYG
jgi:hypothetical protein